jgi:acyl-coenzyme A synthetase/AMP-(fatty) acid ligase
MMAGGMGLSWYLDRLRPHGAEPAIIWRDRTVSYQELLQRIDALGDQLTKSGVERGDVVAFDGDYSPTACALLLALAAAGAVCVPLSGQALAQPEERLRIAEVQWLATVDDEGSTLALRRLSAPRDNALLAQLRALDHPGLVIFTSGSTGESKAVLHDFLRLIERYRRPQRPFRILTLLVFDHAGGINTVLHTLANGGTIVVAEERAPDAVCRAVAQHRVQLLPATPTFLGMMLMAEAHRRYDLSSLELVTYGTEVMPQATLTRLRAALPHVQLHQKYGMTEIGIMRSVSPDPAERWVRVGGEGYETRVIDGTLHVRSPFAMMGYLNAPSPFDAEGWLDTGDRVEARGDAILILGRDSDLINVGGEKVYPAEVEAVLLEMPNVRDATVFAHRNAVLGNIVAARLVLHRPEPLGEVRQRVRAHCEPRLARFKIPMRVELADEAAVGERYKKLRTP